MLRYKRETRPGLVALYDIRPGNGAGPFISYNPGARTGPQTSIEHNMDNYTILQEYATYRWLVESQVCVQKAGLMIYKTKQNNETMKHETMKQNQCYQLPSVIN